RFFQPLMDLFLNYLERDGYGIVAEPNRKIAIPFFEKLKNYGYRYTIHFEKVEQGGKTIIISIYLIQQSK
ncbi:MAG: hypothetical protein JW956_08125, partial [Calditrichaceae bacterium]|nr:hypothetical protein [Calditrichaceae bacterium]